MGAMLSDDKKKHTKMRLCIIAGILAILGGTCLIIGKARAGAYRLDHPIYFTEYVIGGDTTIFRYDPQSGGVSIVATVKGELDKCVMDAGRTRITGLRYDGGTGVVQYDIGAGTTSHQDLAGIMERAAGADGWGSLLIYDGGDRLLVSYQDDSGDEKWLSYELATGRYEIGQGDPNGTSRFLTIKEGIVWYMDSECCLYRYDLSEKTRTKVIDHVGSAAVAADTGQIAHIKDIRRKKIYLYDMDHKKTSCIAHGGWNIYYADLFSSGAQWSDDGRVLFYIKSFPGLFNAADKTLMACDPKSGKRIVVYKVRNTYHQFRFIASS